MKPVLAIAAAALALVATSAHAAEDDAQLWTTVSLTGQLSPEIVAGIEVSGRFVDDGSRLGVAFVRPTIGYAVSDDVTLHIGYLHQITVNPGLPDTDENRFFQQTNWRVGRIGGATLHSRTRIELRTVAGARDSGWRLRQRVQLVAPLRANGPSLVLSSEPFFALNSTDWGARAGFDQVRNFVGVSVPLSDRLAIETGFQHRYQRRDGLPDRSDFVLPLTLNVRL